MWLYVPNRTELTEQLNKIGFCKPITPNRYLEVEIANYGELAIILVPTATASLRFTVRYQNQYDYIINWCLGKNWELIPPIYEFVVMMIEKGELENLPMVSQIKPIDHDAKFMSLLEKNGYKSKSIS